VGGGCTVEQRPEVALLTLPCASTLVDQFFDFLIVSLLTLAIRAITVKVVGFVGFGFDQAVLCRQSKDETYY
jgi:hypothetical protein